MGSLLVEKKLLVIRSLYC